MLGVESDVSKPLHWHHMAVIDSTEQAGSTAAGRAFEVYSLAIISFRTVLHITQHFYVCSLKRSAQQRSTVEYQ